MEVEGAWRRKWERLKSWGGKGSHNKPIGCGASGAHALGPDDEEEEEEEASYIGGYVSQMKFILVYF
jgi:hypothetical protein